MTETLPTPPPGLRDIPVLPGPKAADYHFTTRSDSTFIFNVSEDAPDRQHGFYVYSVDNKGRADATPARIIFNAQDKYPPAVYIDEASAVGDIFVPLPGGGVGLERHAYAITDTVNPATVVKDTVPSSSVLTFRWHAEPTLPGTYVTQYKYKLDEPDFIVADSSTHVATYNSGIGNAVAPGNKRFTVRAIDQAAGARQANRRFQMNMSPTSWFAGPDPNAYPYTHDPGPFGATYAEIPPGDLPPSLTGSMLSDDSVRVLPALRAEHRTFFEIYKNRIYVRAENDTVNLNSWIVISGGGVDPDSRYDVHVSNAEPALPDTSKIAPGSALVLHPGPANGSPVGFRTQVSTDMTPVGPINEPSLSGLFPVMDPSSAFRETRMNFYWPVTLAGKVYAVVRAEDGDGRNVGGLDLSISDAPSFAQIVDGTPVGLRTPYQNDLRKRIITFYVDQVPYFKTTTPGFKPAFPGMAGFPTAYPDRNQISFNLPAGDDDPYDFENSGAKPVPGRPSANTVIRLTVQFRGQDVNGRDTTFAPAFLNQIGTTQVSNIALPSYIVSTTVFMDIELCDCRQCEVVTGEGRCVNFSIPITVPAPTLVTGSSSLNSSESPRPGSSSEVGRSHQP